MSPRETQTGGSRPRASAAADDSGEAERARRWFAAAEPVFERFGYGKTTVEAVCAAAGISKRTFYELYGNKADFFGHLLVHVADAEIRAFVDGQSETDSARDQVRAFLDLYPAMFARHPVLRLAYDPEVAQALAHFVEEMLSSPMIDAVAAILERGRARGEFDPDLDPACAVLIVDAVMDRMHFELPERFGIAGAGERPAWAREVRRFILAGLTGAREPQEG